VADAGYWRRRTPGSALYAAGQFTLEGAGANIWGTADAFRYLYQPFSGDGQIVARVNRIDNTSPYAKAGIMLRDTLTAGSAHVILDVKPDGGVEFMQRSTADGATAYLGGTPVSFPIWLRLVRTGSSVSAAVSSNGTQWNTIGNTTVGGTGSGLIGLPVTSQTIATLAAATIRSGRRHRRGTGALANSRAKRRAFPRAGEGRARCPSRCRPSATNHDRRAW